MRINLTVFASGGMGAPLADPETIVELPDGSMLQDLLDGFLEKWGRDLIGGSEDYQRQYLSRYVCVSVNSTIVPSDKARKFSLRDGDMIRIIPLISGG